MMIMNHEGIIPYVYLRVPTASIQMTAMTQENYTEAFAQRSLCAEEFSHTEAFTQGHFYTISFYTQKFLHREVFCLEVKLSTILTNGKAEVGRVREEKSRREKIREEKESEERRCRCAKR